ncbi:hypothetical protein [Flexivirga caeni]|uniref:hypothetical protein n=1 Tax=Flexivirga caeni TaxID=2294115 RepID=UPI0011CE7A7D|nr:hypothetical protein [Flexivirga caeni]
MPPSTSPSFLDDARSQSITEIPDSAIAAIVEDAAAPEERRFAALYIATHRLRRQRAMSEYRTLVDKYRHQFSQYELFQTFDVAYLRSLGDDRRAMERSLRQAESAVAAFPQSPGVLHQYADLVATMMERFDDVGESRSRDAMDAVRRAIKLSAKEPPKYWSTLARLEAGIGLYAAARRSIAEALELSAIEPDPTRALMYNEFMVIERSISLSEAQGNARAELLSAKGEVVNMRGQLLELLGLLAAIIAFIISSVSGASSAKNLGGARDILSASAGMIAIVFAAFSYAFKIATMRRAVILFTVGVLLMVWYPVTHHIGLG